MKTEHNLNLDDLTTLSEVKSYVDEGEFTGQDIIDLWEENQELKSLNKEVLREDGYKLYEEDGDNHLQELVQPIAVCPQYLQSLLELLWTHNMYLDLVLEQDYPIWDHEQAEDALRIIDGAKILLKNFEKETSGGLN